MKTYYLNTTLTFGKYQGKTLKEIADINPSYIEWCILNLNHFNITPSTFEAIKESKPTFPRSTEVEDLCQEESSRRSYYSSDDYYERESYGQYQGSYAQDVEGLSDDFINDVLDGDPEAYWNID